MAAELPQGRSREVSGGGDEASSSACRHRGAPPALRRRLCARGASLGMGGLGPVIAIGDVRRASSRTQRASYAATCERRGALIFSQRNPMEYEESEIVSAGTARHPPYTSGHYAA